MKALFILLSLTLSTLSFAQDGYHSYEETQCESSESCLVNLKFGHVIKMIPTENEEGQIDGARLSSDSYLGDTVYPEAKLCFQGKANEICSMMELMSNGESGHATITKFQCSGAADMIKVKFDLQYDGYGKEALIYNLKKCP